MYSSCKEYSGLICGQNHLLIGLGGYSSFGFYRVLLKYATCIIISTSENINNFNWLKAYCYTAHMVDNVFSTYLRTKSFFDLLESRYWSSRFVRDWIFKMLRARSEYSNFCQLMRLVKELVIERWAVLHAWSCYKEVSWCSPSRRTTREGAKPELGLCLSLRSF